MPGLIGDNKQPLTLYSLGMHDSMLPGCYGGAEWLNQIKISQKQADFTIFALDPRGACAPFALCTPPHMLVLLHSTQWKLQNFCYGTVRVKCSPYWNIHPNYATSYHCIKYNVLNIIYVWICSK